MFVKIWLGCLSMVILYVSDCCWLGVVVSWVLIFLNWVFMLFGIWRGGMKFIFCFGWFNVEFCIDLLEGFWMFIVLFCKGIFWLMFIGFDCFNSCWFVERVG